MYRLVLALSLLSTSLMAQHLKTPSEQFEVVRRSATSPASLYDFVVFTAPGGKQYLISTYRRDMFLMRVDLETGEATRCDTPGAGYGIVATRKGQVFIGSSLSPGARLFEYHVEGNKIEEIAKIENEEALYWLKEAPDGTIYGGTYPGTLLIHFDPDTRKIINLGRMTDDQTHNLLGAISPSGRVYSGIGMKQQAVIEYDPATGKKRDIWPKDWIATNLARVYLGEDGNVYCYPGIPTDSSKDKALRIDPEGNVTITTDRVRQAMGRSPISRVSRPTLKDGTTLDLVEAERLMLTKPDGTTREIRFVASGGEKDVYSIGNGPNDTIFGTSKPFIVFGYDPATQQSIDMPRSDMPAEGLGGQVDALTGAGPYLVLGTYTHAVIYRMQLDNGRSATTDLGELGEHQDRIHALLALTPDRLYVGSISGYGRTGGALGILNPLTGEREVFKEALPAQSVVSLAASADGGLLYLGGSVHGGTGSGASAAQSALLGEWDTTSDQLLRSVVPVPGESKLSGLVVLPEVICGLTSSGKWFVVDRKSFKVINVKALNLGSPTQLSRLVYDAPRGLIYGILGARIIRASAQAPDQVSVAALIPDGTDVYCGPVADASGRLYFGRGPEIVRWTPASVSPDTNTASLP